MSFVSPFTKTHPTGTSHRSYARSANASASRMNFCSDAENDDVGRIRAFVRIPFIPTPDDDDDDDDGQKKTESKRGSFFTNATKTSSKSSSSSSQKSVPSSKGFGGFGGSSKGGFSSSLLRSKHSSRRTPLRRQKARGFRERERVHFWSAN